MLLCAVNDHVKRNAGPESNNDGRGKIRLSKFSIGSSEHSRVEREIYSDKQYIFSVHHHSESYFC